jgi:putative transposase
MVAGMLVRYRYRIDPTPGQRQTLARAFGCARVVYNDALAQRRHADEAGEGITDTEVQRRVITLAKQTPERALLAEVASVALVQACQDARRAYRNWLDSRTGKRRGRRVGQPGFRTKQGRQSIRLTRNGFALRGSRLYVAKVGQVRVRWSRELPSVWRTSPWPGWSDPGGGQRSRNPPRCRVSHQRSRGAAGIPTVHGGEEAKWPR